MTEDMARNMSSMAEGSSSNASIARYGGSRPQAAQHICTIMSARD
eukprot:CAMPEP_0115326898 /NCGR_PEP_ID=MMETSP0270-20121206/83828_1 /TAXON_ID=71861 /ORGANISM="Scrippsiella trochoidea, Strain CCMP3099" /LENGTH=44 /DNA_ID= /DNA_START= /DNA_END= /DNA_ORIENTATION=